MLYGTNPVKKNYRQNDNKFRYFNRLAPWRVLGIDKPAYYPHTAQKKSNLRKSYCHRGMFWDKETLEYINEKLRSTWSPEQISCTPCELTCLNKNCKSVALNLTIHFRMLPNLFM